MFIILIFLFNT
jgi:hypothetical protein